MIKNFISKQDLKQEEELTLSAPVMKANLILRIMYYVFDIVYGKKQTLEKMLVLEILARYPYWAWESAGYHKITGLFTKKEPVSEHKRDLFLGWITLGRASQDNEQNHLFIIQQLVCEKGIKTGWFLHCMVPAVLAFQYYYFCKILFWIRPEWSFAMNAAFESHAEHEYMLMSKANPAWEKESMEWINFRTYPRQRVLADLIRSIALDEREHMHHSLKEIEKLK